MTAEPLRVATCVWDRCQECAAARFAAKWNAGQIRPRAPITTPWWESPETAALYRRGVHLKEAP